MEEPVDPERQPSEVVAEADDDRDRARLAAAFEHAAVPIVLAGDDGHFIAANPAAERLLGHDRGRLAGMAMADVIVRLDVGTPSLDEFVAEGVGAANVGLRRADGSIVDVAAHSVANIEPGVHLSVWRDITEERRAALEIQESRKRLEAIVEGFQAGLLLVDEDGRVTYANSGASRILGRKVAGWHVVAVAALLFADDAPNLLTDPRLTEPGVVVDGDDGTRVRVTVAHPGGSDGGHVVHLEDVTLAEQAAASMRTALEREREAREEMSGLADMKDTFLSAVSHELRTPLTAIRGFADTLAQRGDRLSPDQQASMATRIGANAQRLTSLLDDLLDVDRLRRGATGTTSARVHLPSIVTPAARAVDLARHDLHVDVADKTVEVDRSKLERIVENLVSNAVRHTPPGTRIEVTVRVADDVLEVRVDDAGSGVEPAIAEDVFGMFVKGTTGPATSEGTGVGLALVREFAGLMGGEVELGRSPLGGAAFHVRIPVDGPS